MRSARFFAVGFLLLPAFCGSVFAQNGSGPVPATMFGMHINNLALPGAADGNDPYPPANFTFHAIRLHDAGVTWASIETSRGVYNWTRLDDWVQLSETNGFDLMLTVEDTPQWASSSPSNSNCEYANYGLGGCAMPSNIQDYIDFVDAVVARYRGKIAFYEGWNEANTGWVAPGARTTLTSPAYFTGTQSDLVTLQQDLYQAVHSGDPAAKVVSPSFTDAGQGVTDVNTLLGAGACSYFDILGFHYYTGSGAPESVPQLVGQLRNALNNHGCTGKAMWDTETAWTSPKPFPAFAAPGYLARAYILEWNAGLTRFYWYAWNNLNFDGFFLDNPFTYLNGPAYAYTNIESWMIGATISGCSQNSNTLIYTCTATDPNGNTEWFVWYANSSATADNTMVQYTVPASWNAVFAEDVNGNRVPPSGAVWIGPNPVRFSTAQGPSTVALSSASYSATALAPGSFAAVYGNDLANTIQQTSSPGASLGGTTVSITDSSGATTSASPSYVSPQQVNYVVPPGLAAGNATITVTSGDGTVTQTQVVVSNVSPGLYTQGPLNGPPAAYVLHYSNGVQTSSGFAFSCSQTCTPEPINVSDGDTVYLALYGTGFRNANNVTVQILGNTYTPQFAGAGGGYPGLDQINVVLPAGLAHSGMLPVVVIADTQVSNTVQINIQ